MKRVFSVCFAAVLALGLASCQKNLIPEGEDSLLTVQISSGDFMPGTKGTATTAEKAIKSATLYVFDASGNLDLSSAFTSAEISDEKKTVSVKTGNGKTVYILANAPSGSGKILNNANAVTTLAGLKAVELKLTELAGNNPGTNGFLMMGSETVNVSSAAAVTPTIKLKRPVCKISFTSVENGLPAPYGTITIKQAFLCNVVENQNIAGNAAVKAASMLNKQATSDGTKGHTIGTGSYTASAPGFTYKALSGKTVALNATNNSMGAVFYAFPNASTALPGTTFANPFAQTCTVLVVVATIGGKDYYYPVNLVTTGSSPVTLQANKDYTVSLKIVGLGNDASDPFARIEKGSITATIQAQDWDNGGSYTETL